jgi:hypothetical protein
MNKIINYCIVLTTRTAAVSFFQNPALDRISNPHAILIRIWFFSSLKLQKWCGLDWRIYVRYFYVFAKLHCMTFQSHCSPITHTLVRTRNIAICLSTYVTRRMRMLIVTSVIVFTRYAMSCSNAFHVHLSVRFGIDLDSHRGTFIVQRASCGDWTGPP